MKMSTVAKIIAIVVSSEKGWNEAMQIALDVAQKTVLNYRIRGN